MSERKDKLTEPKSLKENAAWNSIGSFFYMGCQWLITVLVVTFSPNYDNSGLLAFAMSVGLVFYAIGTYSIRPFQISDVKKEYSPRNYIAFRLITNVGSYLLCTIYLAIIAQRPDLIFVSLIYMLFKFDESFNDCLYGIYQTSSRMDYIGKSQMMRGCASVFAFSLILLTTSNIFIAILAMTICCAAITFLYDLPRTSLFTSIKPSIDKAKAFSLLRTCFVAMLANLMLTYVVSAVRQYYGIIEGDSALGIYAAIATPAVVVQAAIGYIYTPFIVPLAEAFHQERSKFLKCFFKILCILAFAMLLLSILLCLIGPSALILVFGDSIAAHVWIFPYVIGSTALVGMLGFLFATLVTMRKQIFSCVMTAAAFIASFSASVALIESFGMNGINLGIIAGCIIGLIIGIVCVLFCKNPLWSQIESVD